MSTPHSQYQRLFEVNEILAKVHTRALRQTDQEPLPEAALTAVQEARGAVAAALAAIDREHAANSPRIAPWRPTDLEEVQS